MLLKMKDDYIVDILYDSEHTSGCPTCDYGSQYIREFWVVMQYSVIFVKSENMYRFACTEDFLFKLFLSNVDKLRKMCRAEFIQFLTEEMGKTESDEVNISVSNSWADNPIPYKFEYYIKEIGKFVGINKIEPFKGTCAKDAAEYLNKYWCISGKYTYNDFEFPESAILQYEGEGILAKDAYWLLEQSFISPVQSFSAE